MDNGHNTTIDANLSDDFSFSGGAGTSTIKSEGISNDPDNLNSSNFDRPSTTVSSRDIGKNALSSSDQEALNGHITEAPIDPFLPPKTEETTLNSQNPSISEIPIDSLNPDILSPITETKTDVASTPQHLSNNPAGKAENITAEFDRNGGDPAKYFEEISELKDKGETI